MASKRAAHLVAVRGDEAVGTRPSFVPSSSVSACTFARRLLDAGRAEEAMRILEGAIEDGKDNLEFQFLLGRAAFRLGDQAHAHRAFRRAVALSPNEAEVYRWLGRLLVRRGR